MTETNKSIKYILHSICLSLFYTQCFFRVLKILGRKRKEILFKLFDCMNPYLNIKESVQIFVFSTELILRQALCRKRLQIMNRPNWWGEDKGGKALLYNMIECENNGAEEKWSCVTLYFTLYWNYRLWATVFKLPRQLICIIIHNCVIGICNCLILSTSFKYYFNYLAIGLN